MVDFHELQTVESIVNIGEEMTDKAKLAIKLNPHYGTCKPCIFRHQDNCPFFIEFNTNIRKHADELKDMDDRRDKYLYEYQGERCKAFKYKPTKVCEL